MWSTLDVGGRPVDLYEPTGPSSRFVLLFLHDADGKTLRESPLGPELLNSRGLACVCPRGGQCWWSSKICPEFDAKKSAEQWLLDELIPLVTGRWELGPGAVAIAGVGMGGQGALRLAFKHPQLFRIAAALDAAIDHHELYGAGSALDAMYASREHCRQDTAVLHIHPARQPGHLWFGADPHSRWFRGNDRLHEKLSALGTSHTFKVGPAATLPNEMRQYLEDALIQESRKLL